MTAAAAAPDWLSLHGGELRRGLDSFSWSILLDGSPNYRLTITPALGKFTCVVSQSNNGKRLDAGVNYPDTDAALTGGLDELRRVLGW